jgi:hypothetical protein
MLRNRSSRNSSSTPPDSAARDFASSEEAVVSERRTNKGMRALFVLACLAGPALVGCSADAEPSGPAPVTGAPGRVAADPVAVAPSQAHAAAATPNSGTARPIGSDVELPSPNDPVGGFVCRPGAFCEDFEEQRFENHWASVLTAGSGAVEHSTASASLGAGSLRLYTADDASTAYLRQEKGTAKGTWSGALGFAFRVAEVPSQYLGGPELTVRSADGPISIRLTMAPEGVFVEQRSTAECLRDRCVPKRTLIAAAHANHWYRVTLGFEVNSANAAPYGRLEASVDDTGDVVATDLTVPFYDGPLVFDAGITQGDVNHRAVANVDDVVLLVP